MDDSRAPERRRGRADRNRIAVAENWKARREIVASDSRGMGEGRGFAPFAASSAPVGAAIALIDELGGIFVGQAVRVHEPAIAADLVRLIEVLLADGHFTLSVRVGRRLLATERNIGDFLSFRQVSKRLILCLWRCSRFRAA